MRTETLLKAERREKGKGAVCSANGKSEEKFKGKTIGKGKGKSKPVDEEETLSNEVRYFQQHLVDAVESYENDGTWKKEIMRQIDLKNHEDERNYFLA